MSVNTAACNWKTNSDCVKKDQKLYSFNILWLILSVLVTYALGFLSHQLDSFAEVLYTLILTIDTYTEVEDSSISHL